MFNPDATEFADLTLKPSDPPGVRYHSGLTVYEERLTHGRWIGLYWQGSGFAEPERLLAWTEETAHVPRKTAGLDLAAFDLELDGQSLHFGWELARMEEVAASTRGSRHAVVELRSTFRPVSVEVHTETDGTGFLTRWLRITNTGDSPAALGDVWPLAGMLIRMGVHHDWKLMLDRETPPFSVGYMVERTHTNEGAFQWMPLPNTPVRLESRMGKSGFSPPFFVVRNEATGEHVVGGLEWSGNWAAELTSEYHAGPDAWLHARIGPAGATPQRILAPGEGVDTPKVHLGLLQADFDGAIQAWHRHLRKSVLREPIPGREHVVGYNHWSYLEHHVTEEGLKFEIDVAADLGAELFIVDAGWFTDPGEDWWKNLGDWEVGNRLPDGLEPVFEHARRKGLGCGLWLDLERMNPESRAGKAHPEWRLQAFGRYAGWNDMNLGNPEAVAYLEEKLTGLIERFKLDMFRLDYNTEVYEGGQVFREGYMENTLWRYYENVHAMYDRIRQRFPHMLMENCAGGGSRPDLAFMRRFHHTQATDWQTAPRCIRIFNGASMALPPERVEMKAGMGMNGHLRGDLDFTMRSCMFGHLTLTGFYPQAGEQNARQLDRVRHHVRVYKESIRPLLSECRMFHHTPVLKGKEPQGWGVWELASNDHSRAVAGVFRLAGPGDATYPLRLRGLDAGRNYRVTFDNGGGTCLRDGAFLMYAELPIRLDRPLTSELLILESVDER